WRVSLANAARTGAPVPDSGVAHDAMTRAASRRHRTAKAMTDMPKTAARRTEVRGERAGKRVRLIYAAAGRIGIGTGIPASIGAHLLAIGKLRRPGVYAPEACNVPAGVLQAG